MLEKTINLLDNKVLPVFSASFILYKVTKNKIPLFKKISKKTQKRINFYFLIPLLALYPLFRFLNQQELINKKQITSPVSNAQAGEKIVYINETGQRRDELPENAIVIHMDKTAYESMIATVNAKESPWPVKTKKVSRYKNESENEEE